MPTRQEMLDSIYDVIGTKTIINQHEDGTETYKTLPVMIGDVLDFILNHPTIKYNENILECIELWDEYRRPIDIQFDSCIEFVYSIINK